MENTPFGAGQLASSPEKKWNDNGTNGSALGPFLSLAGRGNVKIPSLCINAFVAHLEIAVGIIEGHKTG